MLLAGTPNKKERFGRLGIESVYPIPSNIMCVYYLFFSPKICEKLRILIECEH